MSARPKFNRLERFAFSVMFAWVTAVGCSSSLALAEGAHGSLGTIPSQTSDASASETSSKSPKSSTSSTVAASNQSSDADSSIECSEPHMVPEVHSPKPEAPAVLETVKVMAKAAARGDVDKYKACLDEACTIFDESTNKMSTGKDAAVDSMMKEFQRDKSKGKHRTVTIKIDQPFIKVAGDSAVVSYHGEKTVTFDGEKPVTREAFVTQVFIKDGDDWRMSSHTRGQWQEKPAK